MRATINNRNAVACPNCLQPVPCGGKGSKSDENSRIDFAFLWLTPTAFAVWGLAMGWRFRKSIRLSSWLPVNVSGSGVSLGLGPRGANINVSKRGVRRTIGLPGTGISHQSFSAWSAPPTAEPEIVQPTVHASNAALASGAGHQPRAGRGLRNLVIVFGLIAVGLWGMWPDSKTSTPSTVMKHPTPSVATPAEPIRPMMPPPAANRPLTTEEVKEAQILLKALGFDPGGADGILGPMTIAAVKRYEPSRGWPASGEVDIRLLESLRASKAAPAVPSSIKSATPSPPAIPAAPRPVSPPVTVVPNEEMRLASRAINQAEHPCPAVVAAVRLSDGSLRAVCSNSEIYRVMMFKGEWLAMKCSAAERLGVQGC